MGDLGLKGVRFMSYDFYERQFVRGVWVYVLRRILFDYFDDLVVNIFKQVVGVMFDVDKDVRVLIVEFKLFEGIGQLLQNMYVDLMMFNLGGKLRNKRMYRDLVEKVGMRVVKYYVWVGDLYCVVECVKV